MPLRAGAKKIRLGDLTGRRSDCSQRLSAGHDFLGGRGRRRRSAFAALLLLTTIATIAPGPPGQHLVSARRVGARIAVRQVLGYCGEGRDSHHTGGEHRPDQGSGGGDMTQQTHDDRLSKNYGHCSFRAHDQRGHTTRQPLSSPFGASAATELCLDCNIRGGRWRRCG